MIFPSYRVYSVWPFWFGPIYPNPGPEGPPIGVFLRVYKLPEKFLIWIFPPFRFQRKSKQKQSLSLKKTKEVLLTSKIIVKVIQKRLTSNPGGSQSFYPKISSKFKSGGEFLTSIFEESVFHPVSVHETSSRDWLIWPDLGRGQEGQSKSHHGCRRNESAYGTNVQDRQWQYHQESWCIIKWPHQKGHHHWINIKDRPSTCPGDSSDWFEFINPEIDPQFQRPGSRSRRPSRPRKK